MSNSISNQMPTPLASMSHVQEAQSQLRDGMNQLLDLKLRYEQTTRNV